MPKIIVEYQLVGEGDEDAAGMEIAGDIATTLIDDFGSGTWGGYEGPYVQSVKVTEEDGTLIVEEEK